MKSNPTLHIAYRVAKERPLRLFSILLFVLLVILGSLLPPQILRMIIDSKLVPGQMQGLFLLSLLYFLSITMAYLCDFSRAALLTDFGQRLVASLRDAMAGKMERLPLSYFTSHTPGSITSHFANDAEQVNSLFSDGLVNLLIDLSKIVGIFISIFIFSPPMAMITFLFMVVMYFFTLHFRGALFYAQKENLSQLGRVNSHITETLSNIHTIKAYARESYMEKLYGRRLLDNYETLDKVNFYDSLFPTIVQVLKHALIILVLFLSCPNIQLLGISLGMLAASIDLISNLFRPIDMLGQELEKIQEGKSALVRITVFLEENEEKPKDETLTLDSILAGGGATIAFEHLSFRYPDGDEMVLKDINLTIPDKGNLAFIGRTGVGKTTLFRLVLGLLAPTEGKVTYNGVDVSSIPSSLKRRLIGYVEQEFVPVEGSLYDQVRLYDDAITDKQIHEALAFVGLEYMEGAPFCAENLSQGQKQLFSIARAIVTEPPMLLFDEITASLDAQTEKHLVEVLFKATGGRTVLSISHRESTMLSAQLLVLIKEGKVVDQGSPRELLDRLKAQGLMPSE